MTTVKRWRGLVALVVDAVTHGSVAVERVQKETASRAFFLLESVPRIAPVAKVVHAVHDVSVTAVHTAVRVVARGVGEVVDLGLSTAADRPGPR